MEGQFPPACQLRAGQLVRYHVNQHHALVRCKQGLPPALSISDVQQPLNDGSPRSRGSDPAALHLPDQFLIVQFLAGCFHRRKQAGVCMGSRRFRHVLPDRGSFHLACIPLLKRWQRVFAFIVRLGLFLRLGGILHRGYVVPAVVHDHFPGRPETVFPDLRNDLCCVIVTGGIKGSQHPSCNHIKQFPLVFAEFGRIRLPGRGNNRMVVRYLGLVNGALTHPQLSLRQRATDIFLIAFRQQFHCLYHPGNHVRWQIAAVGTRIGQRLVFLIQALGRFQRLVRGKAKHSVGVPLQAGQVVELRR